MVATHAKSLGTVPAGLQRLLRLARPYHGTGSGQAWSLQRVFAVFRECDTQPECLQSLILLCARLVCQQHAIAHPLVCCISHSPRR